MKTPWERASLRLWPRSWPRQIALLAGMALAFTFAGVPLVSDSNGTTLRKKPLIT